LKRLNAEPIKDWRGHCLEEKDDTTPAEHKKGRRGAKSAGTTIGDVGGKPILLTPNGK